MNRQRKWLRQEVIDALKYLHEIYSIAPSSPSHYRYLVALEQHTNPRLPIPNISIIYNFWPNVRDAWRACGLQASFSLSALKLDFHFSADTDERIRGIYRATPQRLARLQKFVPLSKDTQIPVPALALRAVQLKLDTKSHLNWTKPELAILESHRHLSKQRISQALAASGFERSSQALKIIHARQALLTSDKPSHYTLCPLAKLVGFDQHSLTAWCKQGHLPFERKGTVRTKQQGGDSYIVKRTDLAAFFRAHPEMIDFRKINQVWFIELLRDTDPVLNQSQNE